MNTQNIHAMMKRILPTRIIGLLMVAFPLMASAIPQEIYSQIVSNSLPAGFEEIPNALPGQLFMLPSSNAANPSAWFSIQRLSNAPRQAGASRWWDISNEFKVVGRYSDRLGNLDMDILDAELITNNVMLRQRSIQFSMASDLFLLDLRSPTMQTNEMDAIMRRVIKTLASQSSTSSNTEVQGWRNAIICLIMVAMIFVVAIARR